jgi:drug/metabolite transporter (DMT)-like permease
MVCKYSRFTWSILIGMIITGSARSVVVKLVYQSGFRAPLTITLLYLAGQSLSLFVYLIQNKGLRLWSHDYTVMTTEKVLSKQQQISGEDQPQTTVVFDLSTRPALNGNQPISKGSSHGLTIQSEERIQWIHYVPWYAKPAIPAFFNLLNAALRWASLVYIDASVAEMLISGLELTLSVVAARVFRSRKIGTARWMGVLLVAFGIIIIERANNSKHLSSSDESTETQKHSGQDVTLGVILIISQSILSVLQDIAEEIFMQAADFPPLLMLGMEGTYGLLIGLIIYLSIGGQLGIEDTGSTFQLLRENTKMLWWVFCLPFLFLVTGVFNIKATEVTSAMTRNVWKNLRTALVWIISLSIFYFGGNPDYGEVWLVPESFYIMFGLLVMSTGIIVYYWYKKVDHKVESSEVHVGSTEVPCAEENNIV